MAIDSSKSFEVSEDGVTIDSGTGIWIGGGDAVPTHNAPEGSRYFRTSPEEHYVQEGPGNTNNWQLVNISPQGDGLGGVRANFFNDSGTENVWLRRDNHHSEESGPSTTATSAPWVFPFGGEIRSLSFINKKDSTDTDIEIYKNGVLQYTWDIRLKKWSSITGLALAFVAGDKLSIFAKKVTAGNKPDNVLIDAFIAFTDSTVQEIGGTTL